MMPTTQNTVLTWAGRLALPALTAAVLVFCTLGSGKPASHSHATSRPVRKPGGKPSILAFRAPTVDGGLFKFIETNQRRRIAILLFDPSGNGTRWAIQAARRLHKERFKHNLEVVGVMMPPALWHAPPKTLQTKPEKITYPRLVSAAKVYLKRKDITFPCIADYTGMITKGYVKIGKLSRREWITSIFVFPQYARPAEGTVVSPYQGRMSADPEDYLYRSALFELGVASPSSVDPFVGDHPKAPDVTFVDYKGKKQRLKDYRGQVVVFAFLARTCPHCKKQMSYLNGLLKTCGKSARPGKTSMEILGVCVDGTKGAALKAYVNERGYTFPVGSDTDWKISSAFHLHRRGNLPDTFIIARDGTVRYHHRGSRTGINEILHMEISTLLGEKTRPMLKADGYSGTRSCRVCHSHQHTDWTLTRHACAWETLVRMGKENDPKCIKCHVVGYGEKGGFVSDYDTRHLANVQCESCHGRNGCAAFTGKPVPSVEAKVCRKCHDAKHSPRFDFKTARPNVVHNRAAELMKLPRAERAKRLKKLCSGADRQIFSPDTPYIGSAACGKCHPVSLKAVLGNKHAAATRLLKDAAPAGLHVPPYKRGRVGLKKAECLRCHVTGFARPGGFPAKAPDDPLAHSMSGVGCESCHGPGKAHADDPKKPRQIARLGGTCNECNVLPICRRCHDDQNSPRFKYADAIKKARHLFGKAVMPADADKAGAAQK